MTELKNDRYMRALLKQQVENASMDDAPSGAIST